MKQQQPPVEMSSHILRKMLASIGVSICSSLILTTDPRCWIYPPSRQNAKIPVVCNASSLLLPIPDFGSVAFVSLVPSHRTFTTLTSNGQSQICPDHRFAAPCGCDDVRVDSSDSEFREYPLSRGLFPLFERTTHPAKIDQLSKGALGKECMLLTSLIGPSWRSHKTVSSMRSRQYTEAGCCGSHTSEKRSVSDACIAK